MSHERTLTLSSLSDVEDMIDDEEIETVEDFVETLREEAESFGVDIVDFDVDEDEDVILGTVVYESEEDLRSWLLSGDHMTEEEVDAVLAETPEE